MSKDDEKRNQDGPEFTLEEILAEYSVKEEREPEGRIPIPMDPEPPRRKVVPFPGAAQEDAPEAPLPEEPEPPSPPLRAGGRRLFRTPPSPSEEPDAGGEEEEEAPWAGIPEEEVRPRRGLLGRLFPKRTRAPGAPEGDAPLSPEEAEGEEPPPQAPPPKPPRNRDGGKRLPPPPEAPKSKVVSFPGEEDTHGSPLKAGLRRLQRKADQYAEHMFEEEGSEDAPEVRRAEQYIPGVDVEEPEEDLPPRRKRRQPPPAPDLPPQELFRRYSRGLGLLKLRTVLAFLLAGLQFYLSLGPVFGAPLPGILSQERVVLLSCQAGLLALAMLLGLDAVLWGLFRLCTLRLGMDSLVVLSCIAALADALILPRLEGVSTERETFCAIAALALAFTMMGNYMKRNGLRVACRTASSAGEPYLVTLDEGKWNGQDAYAKWSGEPLGFGRQLQAPDGAERVYHVMAPLILLACFLFSVLSSLGRGRPEDLLWCLSATLSAASSLSATLCYAIPWRALSLRLAKSGAALAGWDGVVGTSGRSSILLTDHDLFPPGTVSLNGIKIFGDFPVEKVIGVTATLIRDSGCGLDKLFHDLLRAQGATYRRSSDFCCYEGGGVSAVIRNEVVLVGSASFMHLMEVPLPQGLHVKNAVFCAIDGDLAGLFALKYTLHGTVEPALYALIQNRIAPVLATRDFNIIPAMLQQRFKLPADRMEFPAVERRVELSSQEQEHSSVLTAVLCREGVGPFTEAAVGAKRLRTAVRASAWLTCLGSCAGTVLAFYLTFMAAYTSLTPLNLLVFLLMWLVPTVLISNWVNRY